MDLMTPIDIAYVLAIPTLILITLTALWKLICSGQGHDNTKEEHEAGMRVLRETDDPGTLD